MSTSGTVRWPPEAPVWNFSWAVIDGDSEGIAFRDVYFRNKLVLHKASLPMIRVQYDYGAGPYKDALSGYNMPRPVSVSEGTNPAYRFLAVESYHTIGHYRLTNRWIFRSDGIILPQLYSAGLQYPANHRHHVYWRFDFDIIGASNNLALFHPQNTSADWGYGPGWLPLRTETWDFRFDPNAAWAALRKDSNSGYVISPGPFDGTHDSFSGLDFAVTAYHGNEDLNGRLGTPSDDQIHTQINNENIDGQDIVIWYVAHLEHHASEGGDEWHVCGPILRPFGY